MWARVHIRPWAHSWLNRALLTLSALGQKGSILSVCEFSPQFGWALSLSPGSKYFQTQSALFMNSGGFQLIFKYSLKKLEVPDLIFRVN